MNTDRVRVVINAALAGYSRIVEVEAWTVASAPTGVNVASQANGGEILASSVLKALLSGSEITWGPSRTVALKGLSGEHEIWAVEWSL